MLADDSENNAPSTGLAWFQDRLPPNTTTSHSATDQSSYSDDDGEAEVDPNVLPEDDSATIIRDNEEDDGEDLFNDDYLKTKNKEPSSVDLSQSKSQHQEASQGTYSDDETIGSLLR
ncbi:hypothetical protein ZWY2020_042077 [Hordeum vulgare]|nr:hypothetical protein ZWY2020_042077 [Hordeum vulgare]